ncbi:alpha-galactosidase [Streptomyces sp. Li-HN-5-11]|uniref:alpha-galactosidase n=1 Tax=Streptomyces sp. Li-HN-5-11 TaxID=3075432 RepID=UPI0028A58F63|nr:alpha-galactosidase [Streptomyces sp. Li-HN-5-11]WNM30921.1 alpha-galactosidase [Streptomyces sp. Li-HN-5-11]
MHASLALRRHLRWVVVVVLLVSGFFAAGVARPVPARAEANGVAATPPMGWSSWSYLRKNPTEANIEAEAQAMSTSGLVAAGYHYVNIDDFYYLNPSTTVDSYGRWVVDSTKFPHGMAAVASYVHGLGEKFGMYLTPGIPVAAYNQNTPIEGTSFHARDIVTDTSKFEINYNFGNTVMYYIDYNANPAAAQAYLNSWANLLASWGVDYVKIDGVGTWDVPDIQHWSQALQQTGRPIHFGLSNELSSGSIPTWQQYANSWRIDGDIECYCSSGSYPLTSWGRLSTRFNDVLPFIGAGGPGGWNDLDSIDVGNGSNDGLSVDERRTQITLWAIENSSLLLGTDLTNLDSGDLALLTNPEVVAVDQAGHPARPVDRTTQQQAWVAPNGDGTYTIGLFNLSGSAATVSVDWSQAGFSGTATVRDLWARTNLGSFTRSYSTSLPAHGSALLKVTPAAGSTYTAMYYNIVNVHSHMNLAVSGGSTAAGAGIVQQSADNLDDQQWQLVPTGSGAYKVVNRRSGYLLDVPGASTTNGVQLVQNPDNNAADSQWKATPNGSGGYTLSALSDGKLADVSQASTTAGAPVIQWPSNSGDNQQWTLVPVPDPNVHYRLVNGSTGGRIDVNADSTADSATLVQWQDNGQTDQQWSFAAQSGGAYTIANANSGKLINIPGPTTTAGTQLVQFHDDGNSNSRWTMVDAGPNQVMLKSVYDGQVIDVSGGKASNGTAIIQNTQSGTSGSSSQYWTLVPAA